MPFFTHSSVRRADALSLGGARARGVADVFAGIELRADLGRIDVPRDPLVARRAVARAGSFRRAPSAVLCLHRISRIASCSSWRSPPARAASISTASVPANGP